MSRPVSASGDTATLDPRALGLLVLIAFAVRAALAMRLPPDSIPWSDGREFAAIARSLLAGEGFGAQTLRPPGYPAFMAAVWSLTGPSLPALRLVEAALGALTVAAIGTFGARAFGRAAGTIAMTLAAFHPVLAFLPGTQYSENLLVFVMVLAWSAWLGALLDRRSGLLRWASGGALAGLAMLIRPNVLLLLPGFAVAAALVSARARRAWLGPALVSATALALVLAPWVARNHRVHGHGFFVATGGGRALWLGNNDRTTGRAGSIMLPDSAFAAELSRLPDEIAVDRRYGEVAVEWMREHPRRAVELYGVRLGSLFALWPETYTRAPFLEDLARVAQGLSSAVIYVGAVLGWFALRDSPLRAPMLASIVVFGLAHAMFFSVLRYRMPLEPLLLWAAGAGWAGLITRRRTGRGA